MVNREEILVEIQSVLSDASGPEDLNDKLAEMKDGMASVSSASQAIQDVMEESNLAFNDRSQLYDELTGAGVKYDDVAGDVADRIGEIGESFSAADDSMKNTLNSVDLANNSFDTLEQNLFDTVNAQGDFSQMSRRSMTQVEMLSQAASTLGQDLDSTQEVLKKSGRELIEVEEGVVGVRDTLTGKTEELSLGMKRAEAQTQEFKGELLSTMFFAMQLERVFSGLLDESLGAAGVFDLISNMLKFLFLPIAIQLQEKLLGLSDIIFGLSEETRMWIGAVAMAGFVGAKLFRVLSILMLGLVGFHKTLLMTAGAGKLYAKVIDQVSIANLSAAKSAFVAAGAYMKKAGAALYDIAASTMYAGVTAGVTTALSALAGALGVVTSFLSIKAILITALVVLFLEFLNYINALNPALGVLADGFKAVVGWVSDFVSWLSETDTLIGGLIRKFEALAEFAGFGGDGFSADTAINNVGETLGADVDTGQIASDGSKSVQNNRFNVNIDNGGGDGRDAGRQFTREVSRRSDRINSLRR